MAMFHPTGNNARLSIPYPCVAAMALVTVPRRLVRLGADPWEGFFNLGQSLTRGMKDRLDLE
jgi:hypothetical protein